MTKGYPPSRITPSVNKFGYRSYISDVKVQNFVFNIGSQEEATSTHSSSFQVLVSA